MRYALLTAAVTLSLAGCANQYSDVPEPQGDWVAANPASLTASPVIAPAPPPTRRWPLRQARR